MAALEVQPVVLSLPQPISKGNRAKTFSIVETVLARRTSSSNQINKQDKRSESIIIHHNNDSLPVGKSWYSRWFSSTFSLRIPKQWRDGSARGDEKVKEAETNEENVPCGGLSTNSEQNWNDGNRDSHILAIHSVIPPLNVAKGVLGPGNHNKISEDANRDVKRSSTWAFGKSTVGVGIQDLDHKTEPNSSAATRKASSPECDININRTKALNFEDSPTGETAPAMTPFEAAIIQQLSALREDIETIKKEVRGSLKGRCARQEYVAEAEALEAPETTAMNDHDQDVEELESHSDTDWTFTSTGGEEVYVTDIEDGPNSGWGEPIAPRKGNVGPNSYKAYWYNLRAEGVELIELGNENSPGQSALISTTSKTAAESLPIILRDVPPRGPLSRVAIRQRIELFSSYLLGANKNIPNLREQGNAEARWFNSWIQTQDASNEPPWQQYFLGSGSSSLRPGLLRQVFWPHKEGAKPKGDCMSATQKEIKFDKFVIASQQRLSNRLLPRRIVKNYFEPDGMIGFHGPEHLEYCKHVDWFLYPSNDLQLYMPFLVCELKADVSGKVEEVKGQVARGMIHICESYYHFETHTHARFLDYDRVRPHSIPAMGIQAIGPKVNVWLMQRYMSKDTAEIAYDMYEVWKGNITIPEQMTDFLNLLHNIRDFQEEKYMNYFKPCIRRIQSARAQRKIEIKSFIENQPKERAPGAVPYNDIQSPYTPTKPGMPVFSDRRLAESLSPDSGVEMDSPDPLSERKIGRKSRQPSFQRSEASNGMAEAPPPRLIYPLDGIRLGNGDSESRNPEEPLEPSRSNMHGNPFEAQSSKSRSNTNYTSEDERPLPRKYNINEDPKTLTAFRVRHAILEKIPGFPKKWLDIANKRINSKIPEKARGSYGRSALKWVRGVGKHGQHGGRTEEDFDDLFSSFRQEFNLP